jgi:CO/xanthine dehydrogenase Mo-binding subunit
MAEYLQEKEKAEKPDGVKGITCRGRGIACGFWRGATGGFGAYVRVNNNGTVNLITGVTDISGSRTGIAQIVAEELDLPLDKVLVISGDTDTAPWATMSVGSMTVYSLSVAAYRACQDVKEQLGGIAASKLGVAASEVEYIHGGFQVKTDPAKHISFMDLARSTTAMFGGVGPIVGRGSVVGLPAAPTLSVHAADVEVDKETGSVRILSYAVTQDVGRAINPLLVEGQIQGAVTQGIGWALMEQYVFDKGVLQNTNLLDYRMPTATDIPMIDVVLVEVDSSEGIYGLRHVGEPPMVPALAAVANALYNAAGIRMLELPMTPEAVLNALKKRDPS